jgi:hypothetical protein
MSISVDHELGRAITARIGEVEVFSYVYSPTDAQLESPRPYFFPLRSLAGNDVAVFRPHDHIWHKGLVWSLPNVGPQNFWGGATYYRDRGYAQEDNNGAIRHRDFALFESDAEGLTVDETLDWITSTGETWFEEHRAFRVTADHSEASWTLAYRVRMINVSGAPIPIGSPTTEGRPNAGYGGLFWRGPRSFAGGTVYSEDTVGGDELMGRRGTWLALAGKHDEIDASSTVTFADTRATAAADPQQWFVRSEPFACIAPAPFFSEAITVEPGESIEFEYAFSVSNGDIGQDLATGSSSASSELARKLDPKRWS